MSDIGAMVRRLIDAGTPPDIAAEVVAECFAAGVASADYRSPGAIRTARWRANKEEKEASQTSQCDASDGVSAKKNVPPHPPIEKTTLPNGSAAEAALGTSEETELFRRGRTILGGQAGGIVAKLVKAKGGSIQLARAAIEVAATKADPREYLGAIIRGRNSPEDLRARGEAW
jgi:hypothetical protein